MLVKEGPKSFLKGLYSLKLKGLRISSLYVLEYFKTRSENTVKLLTRE